MATLTYSLKAQADIEALTDFLAEQNSTAARDMKTKEIVVYPLFVSPF